ncbi:hypothetical protein M7I_7633 [Glarea lozoyensis 74030]|uniref:Uncharacterized protein n=1 Tax=Glarea lozoyensis (strain ATCC 74030 / MF5533) TaxID=1104152 RepID=H0EXU3_GLAL7|nr:hypothetical protein M7I_7633 [Glarea lozoyensis 74030]
MSPAACSMTSDHVLASEMQVPSPASLPYAPLILRMPPFRAE